MKSREIRDRYLQFFKHYEHPIVASDALIPAGDPTVLFTSAGMNQFKEYFLGKRTDLRRATSVQKCLRTGDLDNVGRTASHHSFFEMLGNFSFGDYFKKEAILWSWEFLTGTLDYNGKATSSVRELCLRLPAEKLWVSVYEEDDEAFELWRELGVPAERIVRFGQKDNFWPANAPKEGPNGPCGPCSEIYFDADGAVDGPKSVEVWNLVFTQFDRQPDGSLKPLPRRNIDTGMGLERLVRVIQGVETDYETDLFEPLVEAVRKLAGKVDPQRGVFAERAIADHVRAAAFLIGDGVRPSNEGRGYVLRMLIRRAYRLGVMALGIDPSAVDRTHPALEFDAARAYLWTLVDTVKSAMAGSPYSEALGKHYATVIRVIAQEELQFAQTLDAGMTRLQQLLATLKDEGSKSVPGDEAFRLYDTYGFPVELTEDMAEESGLAVDRAGFETALAAQQKRSRAGSQFGGGIFSADTLDVRAQVDGLGSKSEQFVGYETLTCGTVLKGIWDGEAWVTQAAAGRQVALVLARSPFYGESGGQSGDQGTIVAKGGQAHVENTTWVDDVLVHHAVVTEGILELNAEVEAEVDASRRQGVARAHTATHMLHWALREVLGPDTVQAGSFVDADRFRFDFTAPKALSEAQRMRIESLILERIHRGDEVTVEKLPIDEARKSGALAMFGEKYDDVVRVVSIGDYSKEFCGGTHLSRISTIADFRIINESSIAAGTRRIEALVGEAALEEQQEDNKILRQLSRKLGRPVRELEDGMDDLQQQLKEQQKVKKQLMQELARYRIQALVAEAEQEQGAHLLLKKLENTDREMVSALSDALKQALPEKTIAVFGATHAPDQVSWVMSVTRDLASKVHAGKILKEVAAVTGGGGGGRPDFAQAGGKDARMIDSALQLAEKKIKAAMAG